MQRPNIIFVFADQWRAQATGYTGNPNVKTPNLDLLANNSINFSNAVSCCPVCSPYRASLLTGQYPLTHGVFLNGVPLDPDTGSIAKEMKKYNYNTAYIGKWHLDGHTDKAPIPKERRQGFDYWKAIDISHSYFNSPFYSHESDQLQQWDGYEPFAQTKDAINYIQNYNDLNPFLMVLAWGPPHDPLRNFPEDYRKMYQPENIQTRPNVPDEKSSVVQNWLCGYYAHCSALDTCLGWLKAALKNNGIENNTIFIFTSDHGNMLGSQDEIKKQRPWDESVCVPFLFHYPGMENWNPRTIDTPINVTDIMPTLLGLCSIPIPDYVEGSNFSDYLQGGDDPTDGAALLSLPQPFGNWSKNKYDSREYRGIRTRQFTYIQDLNGPWLLYDNLNDPYQLTNLISDKAFEHEKNILKNVLAEKLQATNDDFLPGTEYLKKWNYPDD